VDVPGGALLVLEPVRLPLPLRELDVSPEGSFQAQSHFQLAQAHPGAAAVTATWSELSACPLDPGRLWLDCTIDALAGGPDDPLDCRPSPEDEQRFGGRLAGRRGMPSPMQARCRGPSDAAGRAGLEALADRALGSPRPAVFGALPTLAREAGELFSGLAIKSQVRIGPSGQPVRYLVDHRLDSVELRVRQATVSVNLAGLGLPALEARHVIATRRRGALDLAAHGFTLRAGLLARIAFGQASLRTRGVPAEIPAFVESLFAGATHAAQGQVTAGCTALDRIVCGEINEAPGCLGKSCSDGIAGLARRLEAAFTDLDAEGLDFTLEGQVPIIDRDRDRKAEALGVLLGGSEPGVWTAELRSRAGAMTISGIWAAERAR
jgi:hypothetical protein